MKLTQQEITFLIYLLADHVESGEYSGVKKVHDKRCQDILQKLRAESIVRIKTKESEATQ